MFRNGYIIDRTSALRTTDFLDLICNLRGNGDTNVRPNVVPAYATGHSKPPSIYVAGDDVSIISGDVGATSTDLLTFATRADYQSAAILVVDMQRPAADAKLLLKLIALRQPTVVPIAIINRNATELAVDLMKLGVADVLQSPVETRRLDQALAEAVERVTRYDDTEQAIKLARAKVDRLSPRERSVFNGLICGWPNKIIADELQLSPRTVEIYRSKMMAKLQVRTLAQALQVAFAARITLEDAKSGAD